MIPVNYHYSADYLDGVFNEELTPFIKGWIDRNYMLATSGLTKTPEAILTHECTIHSLDGPPMAKILIALSVSQEEETLRRLYWFAGEDQKLPPTRG